MNVSSIHQLNHQYHPTLNQINKSLHSDKFSIVNRLKSIEDDHRFVEFVHSSFFEQYPICANLRCGSWYVYPFEHCCYFKSTDGHFGEWTFNLRRLNPNVLKWLIQTKGIMIVDSTRKGKVYPDALQRTIPIWCHVLNRIFYILSNTKNERAISLKMPSWILGSEREQIEERAETQWIPKLLSSNILSELKEIQCDFDGDRIHLEPFWIDRLSDFNKIQSTIQSQVETEHILPVILLTASRPLHALELIPNHRRSMRQHLMMQEISGLNFEYIQGAGDDEEHWNRGITPKIFWENKHSFLKCQADEQCLEKLQEIENAVELKQEQKVENDCDPMTMTEIMIKLSSERILKETKGRLYAMIDGMEKKQTLTHGDGAVLDIIERIQREEQCISKLVQNVVICMDDMEAIRRCHEYFDANDHNGTDCKVNIGVYFVADSKKYKQSLRDALKKMFNGLEGSVWIIAKCNGSNVNVVGCVAGAIIIHWIGQQVIDSSFWMGSDRNALKETDCLDKRKIRGVLEKFQFLIEGFHPSRMLMKQINTHFLAT